ncbi:RadC family protein [Winogradskyella aurantiaca]|uniref:RadC family protein n=1 Tax=Winogradskyella aurantiaca TaxID=2219558 RepID=UPI000E1C8D2C|nr:DNA repair protein RadC [Winogradskyella aurantiaca]
MAEFSNSMSIKSWSQDDQPREKLRDKGRNSLSNAELIAILIGSGSKNESAVALSKRILSSVDNNLYSLGKLSLKQLMKFKGIGEAKAIAIAAALEIGRRRGVEGEIVLDKIESSNTVFRIMQPIIGDLPHEEFWILFLNNSNKILRKQQLSRGGMTGTLVDTRLVMKQALEEGATSIILIHNHPSGTLRASKADKSITQKLKAAGELLDVKVLDHLIVTEHAYFSFADEGFL